ncbi:MAG: serine hydrolase domain-containing protein, partial [Gemmatimonadota bacterium]
MSIEILSDLVHSRKPLKGESQRGSPPSLGVPAPFRDGGSRRSAPLSWSLLYSVVALAAGWPGPLGAQLDSVVVADAWARVDSLAASVVRESGLPGLALAITDERALMHEVYLGEADIKTGRPVTAATLFQIGSITKSFTALSLMRLADRGIFDPDRPVSEYLPWFSVRSEFGPITGHHLLTHSAGIPSNRDDIPSSPYQAFALRERRTAWAPGERFLYSNVGYQVLSVLLERLDGRPYERILAETIFAPARMETARPVITLESRQAQAVGYIPPFDDRPHHPSRGLIEAPHFPYDVGDGSIQATARDLAAYARLILNRGVGPGGRVVTEDAFRRFSTGYVQDGTARYGYGIRVQE